MQKYRIVVYAYVCGDILHKGHLLHLKNCKAMGDILVVAVLTDEAVMEKKNKPVISFEERLELVHSLSCVDVVIPQHTYGPWSNIKNIKPDILVESESHSEEILNRSQECVNKIGSRLIIFPYYDFQSSTKIKNKIIKSKIKEGESIFRKKISVLPEGEKVHALNEEAINSILNIRQKKIELDPGMGGIDPCSLDHLLEKGSNLVSLDIAITAGCNFKCIWCYRPGNEWGKMFFNFSKIQEIINDALKLNVQYFIITGGEPMMYKDGDKTYFDVIDYIIETYKDSKIEPSILTFSDVALIIPEIAQKLADRKVALCLKRDSMVSIIQDTILGVNGGHYKMENGYKNLFAVGYGSKEGLVATVNTVLAKNISNKDNVIVNTTDGLIDLHVWIRKMNMEHSVVPIHYCGEAKGKKQEKGINPLDIKVLYDIMSAIDEIEFNDKWKVYSAFPKNKTCNRPGRGLHIRSTGDVTSCSESPLIDDYIFGNINSTGLTKIALSDKFINFRKDFDDREGKYICNSRVCDLYGNKLCRGGCATRSAYSKINIETGCMEENKYEVAYMEGREDPFCPGWITLAKKQNALKDKIYDEYVDYYLSKSNISSSLKDEIRNKVILEFYEKE